MSCCDEYGCKREHPIEVRRAPFSGKWTAITRYKRHDSGVLEAQEKHVLTPVSQAEIELRGSVLLDLHAWIKEQYGLAESGSGEERAYEAVLDKLAALAEAKETELLGPRPESVGQDTGGAS